MSEKDRYKNRIELLRGTLDMLILQTLQWGPRHGYGIVQALRLRSGDVLSDLGRWERIVEAIGSVMYVKPEESES